jgi:hypothetical protein
VKARTVETKVIYQNHKITIPWNWTGNSDVREVGVTWNPTKTTINRIAIRGKAFSDVDATYLDIFLNDTKVVAFDWPFGAGAGDMWRYQAELDVTYLIYNGKNYVKAEYVKGIWTPLTKNCYVWLDLIVDYTGIPPTVPPPSGPPVDYTEILKWAAIGVVAIGGVYLLFKTREKWVPQVKYYGERAVERAKELGGRAKEYVEERIG